MKQKIVGILIVGFLGLVTLSSKVQAAEGDVWITPVDQNIETSQYFDVEIHANTGSKQIGAFNLYFDFTAADLTIDTGRGSGGVDKGADASNYNIMVNPDDLANGHFRIAGICASGCASGTNVHLATIHNVSSAAFASGTSTLALRLNELTNELGVALATGAKTGAIITHVSGDTSGPIVSGGSPTGTLPGGTTGATLAVTTNENATCKFGIISGTAYASIANTFTTTGGTNHSETLSGLHDGTNYHYYVRCSDGSSNLDTFDYAISFNISNAPTNIALSNAAINENQAVNTVVGALTTTDADSGDTHAYSLGCNISGANDSSFNISGSNLRSSASFDYETKNSYDICIRTNDGTSTPFDKNFTITVNNLDDVAPVIAEVTPVATPTTDNTPNYVFTTDETGTIAYTGDCSSANTSASIGSNTVTFNTLADGVHSNCTVKVTDASGNASNILNVPSFTVDATIPTIVSISSTKANGIYTTGTVIDINVIFSENVTSTGDVTVTLETGSTDRSCTFTVSGTNSGTCNYTVQAGDTSGDLNVNNIAGVIKDVSNNTLVNFTPTTNLAANKALVIDTTAPIITVNQGTDTGPTGDDTINLTATDTNIITSSSAYGFSVDNTCNASDTYGTTFTSGVSFHITTNHTDYLCAKASDGANTTYQLVGQLNVADVNAPVISSGSPTGDLSSGTTNATLSVTTDENATCKYSVASGTAYDAISDIFTTTGARTHTQAISGLTDGTDYDYYVRCSDSLGNKSSSDYHIGFSVASVEEINVDDESSDVSEDDISTPYLKIATYVKEKLTGSKTFYSKKKEFSFKGDDNALAGGEVRLYKGSSKEDKDSVGSNGEWQLKVKEKDNKTYDYKIKYYDASGKEIKSKKFSVKVDAQDPELTDLPAKLYKTKGAVVWWKAKDNLAITRFKVYFNGKIDNINADQNGKDVETKATFTLPSDILAGTYPIDIRIYDKAGNTTLVHTDIVVQ